MLSKGQIGNKRKSERIFKKEKSGRKVKEQEEEIRNKIEIIRKRNQENERSRRRNQEGK